MFIDPRENNWDWCPDCGEPRGVCRCTSIPAAFYEAGSERECEELLESGAVILEDGEYIPAPPESPDEYDDEPMCSKCGKRPAFSRHGRTYALCAVCADKALERLFDEVE